MSSKHLFSLYVVTVLLFSCYMEMSQSYKHVIFMHGILSGPWEFEAMHAFIEKVHPSTRSTSIKAFTDLESLEPIWNQVFGIQIQVQQIMNENPEGVHLICYSQGGVVCRGLLSILKHNVESFIVLSAPLAGQFGDTEYLRFFFPNYIKENIYKYFYTDGGQEWSIANYWNDPHHQALYRNYSTFLAVVNNQTSNPDSQLYKQNFLRLKKLVLIGGPDDGVITPWQSSHFGSYDKNENVIPFREQQWYKDDSFGLKTLDARKAIHIFTVPNVQHLHWYSNYTVFECCVLPFLT